MPGTRDILTWLQFTTTYSINANNKKKEEIKNNVTPTARANMNINIPVDLPEFYGFVNKLVQLIVNGVIKCIPQ